jgi:hypothetical protein
MRRDPGLLYSRSDCHHCGGRRCRQAFGCCRNARENFGVHLMTAMSELLQTLADAPAPRAHLTAREAPLRAGSAW